MARADHENRFCRLEEAVGRHVACPEEACALWEPGGAALEGRCVLQGIDFSREPGLAGWLLDLRGGLEADRADRPDPGHELRRLLNQSRE